jgi:hypothetical protein
MKNNPSTAQKYIALATLLPVMADWIEELRDTNLFRHEMAQKFNAAVNSIRMADQKLYERTSMVMPVFDENGEPVLSKKGFPVTRFATEEEHRSRNLEMAENQIAAQTAFRQWIANEVNDPYESIVHSEDQADMPKQKTKDSSTSRKSAGSTGRKPKGSTRKPKVLDTVNDKG